MSGPTRSHGRISVTAAAAPRELGAPPVAHPSWTARVLTLFPEVFPGPLGASLTGRALAERIWALEPIDIRRFATDRHRTVDGPPAGGGPGMVMRPDVLAPAIRHAMAGAPADRDAWPLIALSPRGRPFDQARARALAAGRGVTLLCGRFEGIDQRILDAFGVEEVSVGDFVMTGGEIPAMALLDATVRLIPRVLGNPESVEEESFSHGLLEHPQYTKPAVWEGRAIPEVLLSGHHARVAEWRRAEAEALTQERRPDLRGARGHAATDPRGPEPSVAHTSAGKGGTDEGAGR